VNSVVFIGFALSDFILLMRRQLVLSAHTDAPALGAFAGLRLYGGLDEFAFGPREAKSTIKWKTLAQFMR
jgi:hypothetical protein